MHNMLTRSLRRPRTRAWLLGTLAAVPGLASAAYGTFGDGDRVFLVGGLGALLIGIFTVVMVSERSTPAVLLEAQRSSSVTSFMNLIESLRLAGDPVYVPARKNGSLVIGEKMFVPLKRESKRPLPALDDGEVFYTGIDSTAIGAALDPPGREMLDIMEDDLDQKLSGTPPPRLEEALRPLVRNYSLLRDINIKLKNGPDGIDGARIILELNDENFYRELCERYAPGPNTLIGNRDGGKKVGGRGKRSWKGRPVVDDTTELDLDPFRYTAFPVTSLVCCALVRSVAAPMVLREAVWEPRGGRATLDLERLSRDRWPGAVYRGH